MDGPGSVRLATKKQCDHAPISSNAFGMLSYWSTVYACNTSDCASISAWLQNPSGALETIRWWQSHIDKATMPTAMMTTINAVPCHGCWPPRCACAKQTRLPVSDVAWLAQQPARNPNASCHRFRQRHDFGLCSNSLRHPCCNHDDNRDVAYSTRRFRGRFYIRLRSFSLPSLLSR